MQRLITGATSLGVIGAAALTLCGAGLGRARAADTLEQTCIAAGMKPMKVLAAEMHGVHKQHGNGWSGRIRVEIEAMPQECAENGYYRVLNDRVQLQNGAHRARWSMIYPWSGDRWNGRNNGYGGIFNEAAHGGGPSFYNISYEHDHTWTKWAYKCSPGPKKTGARYQEMQTVIHTTGTISDYGYTITGAIQVLAGPKITNHRLKVAGAC